MYRIELNYTINKIILLFYKIGLWHHGDEITTREAIIKSLYSIYFLLFPVSLIAGAIKSDTKEESIFLVLVAIMIIVLSYKLLYIIWKKKQILELLHKICVYSIENQKEFTRVNGKLKNFMKFVNIFLFFTYVACVCAAFVVPFLGTEKTLFYNIGFPWDWKNNEIAYWVAFLFVTMEVFLAAISVLFSILMWYLMINCVLKYETLGYQLQNMGVRTVEARDNELQITDSMKQNLYQQDFIKSIKSHQQIKESVDQLHLFLSNIFFLQMGTSGLCICCSIYSLAFNKNGDLVDYLIYLVVLLYSIFDIFMVMYFGNDIKLSSDRLSYCLFESNWIDQTHSCKRSIIIFTELLMRPHELIVGKIYPLTLETFTRILRNAYNMFNILKTLATK